MNKNTASGVFVPNKMVGGCLKFTRKLEAKIVDYGYVIGFTWLACKNFPGTNTLAYS